MTEGKNRFGVATGVPDGFGTVPASLPLQRLSGSMKRCRLYCAPSRERYECAWTRRVIPAKARKDLCEIKHVLAFDAPGVSALGIPARESGLARCDAHARMPMLPEKRRGEIHTTLSSDSTRQ